MVHNPQTPGDGHHDPAGSTQMFRAFVDEGAPQSRSQGRRAPAPQPSGPRVGVIVGVVVAIAAVAAAAWLALS